MRNDRLSLARRRLGLTQEELAQQANAQVEALTGSPGAMDADYISKLERGIHTWPGKHYRRALRLILEAVSDAALGFYSTRAQGATVPVARSHPPGESDDVKRQAFLHALAAVTTAGLTANEPAAFAFTRAADGVSPLRIGFTEVEQVRHASDLFGDWQDIHGGGVCKDALAAQVRWATQLLHAEAEDQARDELFRAVGFLVDIAGWGAFDAGDHATARSYFQLALSCAEQINDWSLRANVLSDMARQALYLNRTDDGLSLIELAQVRSDRQTPTVRAMLSLVHSRALATAGRVREARRVIHESEEHFSRQRREDDPPWISYFDNAEFAGESGEALGAIAFVDRQVDPAREKLLEALNSYSPQQVRSRALTLTTLALLEFRSENPEQGVTYGRQALRAETGLRSDRAQNNLSALRSSAARFTNPHTTEFLAELDNHAA